MQKNRAKMPSLRRLTKRQALVCGSVILLIALVALLCISINMRSHIQHEYAKVRNGLGESLYSNMYMMMQTFDMSNVPNADMENAILPQMKAYYIASKTLNEELIKAYGEKYRVLSTENIAIIDKAFEAYETAFRDGTATDLAKTNMQACMDTIRSLLSSRFSEGILKAAR